MKAFEALENAIAENGELATRASLEDLRFEMQNKTLWENEIRLDGVKIDNGDLKGTILALTKRNRSLRCRAQRAEAHCKRLVEHIQKYIESSTKKSATAQLLRKWYGD